MRWGHDQVPSAFLDDLAHAASLLLKNDFVKDIP